MADEAGIPESISLMEKGVGRYLNPGEQIRPSETVDYLVKSENMEVASIVAVEIVHSSFEGSAGVAAGEGFLGSPSIANVPDEKTSTKQETCQAATISYQAEKTMLDKEQIEKENPASVVQETNDSWKDDEGKKSEKDAELKTCNEAVVLMGSTGQDEGSLNLNPDLTVHNLDNSVDTSTQPTLKSEEQSMESNGEKISGVEREQADSCSSYLDEEKTPDVAKPIENIGSGNEDNKNDSITQVSSIMATSLEIHNDNEESSAITDDGKGEPDSPSVTLETDRSSTQGAQPEVGDNLEETSYVESTKQNQCAKDSITSLDETQDKCHGVNPSIIQTKDLCLQELDKAEAYEVVSETLLEDVAKSGSQESKTEALKTKPEADSSGAEKVKGETANEGRLDSLFMKHEDGEKNKVEEAAICEASAGENRDKSKDSVIESENNIRDAVITPEYNQHESRNEVKTSLEMVSEEIDAADAMTCTKEDILIKNQEESFDKEKEEKPIDIVDVDDDEIKKLENLPSTKLNEHTEILEVEIQNKLSSELETNQSLEQERIFTEFKEVWQNSEFEPLDQVHEANGAKKEEKQLETDSQAFEITENTILDPASAKEAVTREPSSERCEAETEKSEKIQESDSEMQSEIKNAKLSIKEDVQNKEEACETEMYKSEITGDDGAKCQTEESSSEKINSTGFLHETIDKKFQAANPYEAAIALKDEDDNEKTKSTTNEEVSDIRKIIDGEQIRNNVTNLSSEVIDKETVEGYQQTDKQVDNSNGDDTSKQIMEGNSTASISLELVEESPVKKFQNYEENTASSRRGENLVESETAETIDSIISEAKRSDEIPSSTFQCSLVQVQEIVQTENTTVSEGSSVEKIALEKSCTENGEDKRIHSGVPPAETGKHKETVKGGEDVKEKMQKNECQEYIEHPLNIMSEETNAGTLSQLEENTVEERAESQKMESEKEKEENSINGSNIKSLLQESIAEDPANFQNNDGCTDKSNTVILEESKAAGTCGSFANETNEYVECPIETPASQADTTVSSEGFKIVTCTKDDTTIENHEESPDKKNREETHIDVIRHEFPKEENPLPRELNEKIEIAEGETLDKYVDELDLTLSIEEKLGEVPDFEPEDQVHEANANRQDPKNYEKQSEMKDAEMSKNEDVQKKEETHETEMYELEITSGDTKKYHTEESSSEKINSTDLVSETIEQNFQAAMAMKDEEDNEKTKSTTNEEIIGNRKDTDDAQMRDNVTKLSSEVINEGRVSGYRQTNKEADNSQEENTKEHITEGNSAACISLEAVEDIPDKYFKNDEKTAENSSIEILVEFESAETVGIITREAKHSDEIPNSTVQCSLVQEHEIAHSENATISEGSSVEEINVESYIKNGGEEENQLGLPLSKIGEHKKEILKGDEDVEEKLRKNECQENIEHQLNVIISVETELGASSQLEENTIQEKVESVQDNKMESETEKEENIINGSNIKSLPQESVAEDPVNFQNDDGCTDKSNAVILEESKAAGTCESSANKTYQNVECPIGTQALLVDTTVSSEGFKIIKCAKDDRTIKIHEESPDKKDREETSAEIGDIRNELQKEKNPLPRELNEKNETTERKTPNKNVNENLAQSMEEELGEVPDFEPEEQIHEANANRADVKNDEKHSEIKDSETSKKEYVQKKEEAGGDTTKYHTEESSSEKINSTDLPSKTIELNFQAAKALKDEEDNDKIKSTTNEEITDISKDTDDAQMRDNVTNLSSEVINEERVKGYQQPDKQVDISKGENTKAACISLEAVEGIPNKNFKNDEKNTENSNRESLVESETAEAVGSITHETKHSDEIPDSTLQSSLVQEQEIAQSKNGEEKENQSGLPLAKVGEHKEILKDDEDVEEKMQKNECQENIEYRLNIISAEIEAGTLGQLEENTIEEKFESMQDSKMESETEKEENIINGRNINSLAEESVAEDPVNFQNDDGCTDKSNTMTLEKSRAAGTCKITANEISHNAECPIETIPRLLADTTISSECFETLTRAKDESTVENQESFDKQDKEKTSVYVDDFRNEIQKEENPQRELNEKIQITKVETLETNVDELDVTQSTEPEVEEIPDLEPQDQVHAANVSGREEVNNDETESQACQSTTNTELELPWAKGEAILDTSETETEKLEKAYELESKEMLDNKDAEISIVEDTENKEETCEKDAQDLATSDDTSKYHTEEVFNTASLHKTIEQNSQAERLHEAATTLEAEGNSRKTVDVINEEIMDVGDVADEENLKNNFLQLSSEKEADGSSQQPEKEADKGDNTEEQIIDQNNVACISQKSDEEELVENFQNCEKNSGKPSSVETFNSSEVAETAEKKNTKEHESSQGENLNTCDGSSAEEIDIDASSIRKHLDKESYTDLAEVVMQSRDSSKGEDVEQILQKGAPNENIKQPLNVISVEIKVETSSQMGDNIIEEKFDSPHDISRDEGIEKEKDIASESNITSLLQDSVEQNHNKSFRNDDNSAEKSNNESLEESEAAGTSEHIMHEANQNNETPAAAIALSLAKEVESLQCEDEGIPAEASPEEKKEEESSFQIDQFADSITMLEENNKEIDKETLKTVYQFAHEMNQKEERPNSSSQASMVKEDAEQILQKDEPKESIEMQHKTVEETTERLKYNENDKETEKGDIIKESNIRSLSLESVADEPIKNFENDGASTENSSKEIPEQSEAPETEEKTTDEANENDSLGKTTPASPAEDVESLMCEDKDLPEEASPEKKKEESSFKIDDDIEKITMTEEDNKDRDQETSKIVSANEIMSQDEESLNSSTEAPLIREQQTPEGHNLIVPVALTIDEQEKNNSSIKMDEGKDNNVPSAGAKVGVLSEVANNPKDDIGQSSQDRVNETKMAEEEDISKEHIIDDCNNKSPSEESIEERTDKIIQNDENSAEMSNKEIFEEFATGKSIVPVKEEESLQSEGNYANLAEAMSEEKREDDASPIKASEVNESNADLAEAIKNTEKEISHGEEIIEPKLRNEPEEFLELSGDVINEESKAGMLNEKADDISIPEEVEAIHNSEQTGENETKGNKDIDGRKDTNALATENFKVAGKTCDDNIIVEEKSVTSEMEFETVKTDGLDSVEKLAKATRENTEDEVLKCSVSVKMVEEPILDKEDFVKKSEVSIKENDATEKATPEHEAGKQNLEVDISGTKNYEIQMEENLKLAESSMKLDHTSEIVTSDQSNEISPNKLEEKEISESLGQRSVEYLETQQETEEKKELEVEDEYQIKETQNSKDIKDAILPEKVDKEVEKKEGNDTVEHFKKDKNDISEVYTVSIGDERIDKVKEGRSAITGHLEVTDSNEKTKTASLEVQEAQNFKKETTVTNEKEEPRDEGDTCEKDAGLLTTAPTKETTEVIKKEIIDNTDSSCNKIKATTVMKVTAEHSLEKVQTDEKPMKVSNMPPDSSNAHAAEADASQQESMALEKNSSNLSSQLFTDDQEKVTPKKLAMENVAVDGIEASRKASDVEELHTGEVQEEIREASKIVYNSQDNEAVTEAEVIIDQAPPEEIRKEHEAKALAMPGKEEEFETKATIENIEESTEKVVIENDESPKIYSALEAIEERSLQQENAGQLEVSQAKKGMPHAPIEEHNERGHNLNYTKEESAETTEMASQSILYNLEAAVTNEAVDDQTLQSGKSGKHYQTEPCGELELGSPTKIEKIEENITGKEFLDDESKTSEEVCWQKEEIRELQFSKLDLELNEDTKESPNEAAKEASETSVEIEDKKEASLSISDSNLKGNREAKEEEIYPIQTNPMEKSKEQDQMPSYTLLSKEQEDQTSALIGSTEEKTKEIEEPKMESKEIEEAYLQKEEPKELKVFSFESQLDKDAGESLKEIHQREHGPTDHEKEETKEVPELVFNLSSQDYTAVAEDKIPSNQPEPTEKLEEQKQTSSAGLLFEEQEHIISRRALESKEEKMTGVEVKKIAPKTIEEVPWEFMKLEPQLHDDIKKESPQVVHETEDGPAEEPLKLQPQHEIKKGDAAKTDQTAMENKGDQATDATEKMITEVPNEQIMEAKNEAETPSAISLGKEATKESHREHRLIDEETIGAKILEKETQNGVLPEGIAKADESETTEKHISTEKGTAESLHQAFVENETVKEHFPAETGETNIKEEREMNNENECAEGISGDGNMGFTSAKEKDLSVETCQKEGAAGLAEATEIVQDIHQQEKTSESTLEDQTSKQTEPATLPSTGKKEVPEVLQEPNVETTRVTEARDLQPVYTTDADSEVQRLEYGTKHAVDCKNVQAIEETVSNDSAKISLYDMMQQSRREKHAATQLSEESELMASKEEVKAQKQTGEREKVKSDEEAEEEVDEEEEEREERKKNDSGSDAPVMVEASRDIEIKVVHKKSHNILSGVGSKVKHSIIKVKKAITGKSSHPKQQSPK